MQQKRCLSANLLLIHWNASFFLTFDHFGNIMEELWYLWKKELILEEHHMDLLPMNAACPLISASFNLALWNRKHDWALLWRRGPCALVLSHTLNPTTAWLLAMQRQTVQQSGIDNIPTWHWIYLNYSMIWEGHTRCTKPGLEMREVIWGHPCDCETFWLGRGREDCQTWKMCYRFFLCLLFFSTGFENTFQGQAKSWSGFCCH